MNDIYNELIEKIDNIKLKYEETKIISRVKKPATYLDKISQK